VAWLGIRTGLRITPDPLKGGTTLLPQMPGVTVMSEPSQTDVIHCAVCGSDTRVPGYGQQFGTLLARWGYGSQHDGERYQVHLCEPCFFQTLAYLRQERRIHTLFDDEQPTDDQVFGRVVRDDFFGDV